MSYVLYPTKHRATSSVYTVVGSTPISLGGFSNCLAVSPARTRSVSGCQLGA